MKIRCITISKYSIYIKESIQILLFLLNNERKCVNVARHLSFLLKEPLFP
ncbi:hypothetical protein HanRHA438_Chr02g0063411 [Helianthus annuus]|nr:hypothetical protein HanRHA438_Chr02g0063411 [Helianthus annuus]